MQNLVKAKQKAESLIALIDDVCLRVEIAGSIRRRKSQVKDIEIVALPKTKPGKDLFGNTIEEISFLEIRLNGLLQHNNDLSFDPELKRNGHKYKRLLWHGVKVDLFIAGRSREYGALMAIRTGPWDFSKMLVTKQEYGGAMPNDFRQQDNQIWTPNGPLETSNELKYFAALGIPFWLPWERSEYRLRTFLRKRIAMKHELGIK